VSKYYSAHTSVALIHMEVTRRAVAPHARIAHDTSPRLTLVAVAETCLQLERLIMRRGEVYKSEEARYRYSTVLYIRIAITIRWIGTESHNTYTILHDMQLQMARHRHT
jgi:hypothetical protein